MSDESERFAKQALKLVTDDLPRVAAVQKRLTETTFVAPAKGREFKDDDDPKRGSQSPLGGKIW